MVFVEERLADRIALVVMPAAGKGEEFGFEVGQPGARSGSKTWPASNFAEATAMRLALSPSGFTAMIPETWPRSS